MRDKTSTPFPLILSYDGGQLNYRAKLEEHRRTLFRADICCNDRSMSVDWRSELIDGRDGWLSPRMYELLRQNAEITGEDEFLDDGFYEKLIPYEVLSKIRCAKRRFLEGFLQVIGSIAVTLKSSRYPTVGNILETVHESPSDLFNSGDQAEEYLLNGGRIEFAIDALLKISKQSADEGEFDQMLEDEDQENLPETPFDHDYDLVRVMCLDHRCFVDDGVAPCANNTENCEKSDLIPILTKASTDLTVCSSDDCDEGYASSLPSFHETDW